MLFASLLLAAATAAAPQAQPDPTIASTRGALEVIKGYVTKAAEQVPEEMYAFKPTPDVRSLGQLFGHIADANFMICSMATGMKPDMESIEKTKTSKADLAAALAASFKFCDAGFREADGGHRQRDGQVLLSGHPHAPQRADLQHGARLRALREHRHLHAPQGSGPAVQRKM